MKRKEDTTATTVMLMVMMMTMSMKKQNPGGRGWNLSIPRKRTEGLAMKQIYFYFGEDEKKKPDMVKL